MTDEMKVNWRFASQRPAPRALLLVETDKTTLRKVEFEGFDRDNTRDKNPVGWVLAYWHGVNLNHIRVPFEKIKRWAYETDESVAELNQFSKDMVVEFGKHTIESLERRIASAHYELEKVKAPATAEVELAIHNALRHLSGEIEREERAR